MNILCVIPARGGSKGVKNKNIALLKGKPVMGYTIAAAQESKRVNKIVVSTEDKLIAAVAEQYKVQVVNRPKKFALDTSPIELALRHAVRFLKKSEDYSADVVVWLQANVPIRKKGMIDQVIETLIKKKATTAATVYKVSQLPYWMKTMDRQGVLSPFMGNSKIFRRQDFKPLYLFDGAVVAMTVKALMDSEGQTGQHVYMGDRIIGVEEEFPYNLEIDEPEDFKMIECFL